MVLVSKQSARDIDFFQIISAKTRKLESYIFVCIYKNRFYLSTVIYIQDLTWWLPLRVV